MRPPHTRTALLAALLILAGTGLTPRPGIAADEDAYRNGYARRMVRLDDPVTVGDPDEPDTRAPLIFYLPLTGRVVVVGVPLPGCRDSRVPVSRAKTELRALPR